MVQRYKIYKNGRHIAYTSSEWVKTGLIELGFNVISNK